jgi:hypothetical protein
VKIRACLGSLLFIAVLASAQSALASHYTYCGGSVWKYADGNISWNNLASGDWWYILNEEAKGDNNSWHNYTDVVLTSTSTIHSDQIRGYAQYYGDTGWAGLWEPVDWDSSTCTTKVGKVKLNRTILRDDVIRSDKKFVTCQEIGHALSLHHVADSTTCMDDRWTGPNEHFPNSHDRSAVNAIY